MTGQSEHKIFDARLLRQRMNRACRAADFPDFIYRLAADEICDRLKMILRNFETTLILADGPDDLAERLGPRGLHGRIINAGRTAAGRFITDFEQVPIGDESVECIVSVLNLHSLNDVPGALIQYRRALKPDGVFIAAVLGGETFHELRQAWLEAEIKYSGGASPRVAPFGDVRSLGALLQRAGFALPVADCDRTVINYGSALAAMREIKRMGWSNALCERSRKPVTRRLLAMAAAEYEAAFASDHGRVPLTVDIVYLTGWAPHESQQRPLKPGSAKMRLADGLKAAAGKSDE